MEQGAACRREGGRPQFVEKILTLPVHYGEAKVEFTSLRGDRLRFGWQDPFLVNGEIQPLYGFKHFENSYWTCEMGTPEMESQFGPEALRLYFKENPAPAE
jgi:hypothetical protein